MAKFQQLLITLFCILFLLPSSVFGECTCDAEDEGEDKPEALKYKIVGFVSILLASALGVCIPLLGRTVPALRPEKDIFFLIKAFAAGVILSTGFIHVLPDAFENLTSPCLSESPWQDFPFTGFVAMMSAIGTLMVDAIATSYYKNSQSDKVQQESGDAEKEGEQEGPLHVDTHTTHGHSHGSATMLLNSASSDFMRHRVITQVLELGIVVHSVIIGIAVGTSMNPETLKPLVAALTFHQFFEGMGLGGCITQAKFKSKAVAIMSLFFSLTTPVGIIIGLAISNVYSESSPTALIVQGVFDSASAGILIYMALVDLLAADFMSERMQNNGRLQIGANVALLLGTGLMTFLAKWA
nr:zinc transporter 8-like [Quercus suber]POE69338.1 zinc transporter 5 [Quercus suber]